VTGPYRVGLEFQHAATPSIGLDADGRTPASNFVDLGGSGWGESSASGDFILRSTIDLPEPRSPWMLAAGCALLVALARRRARGAEVRAGPAFDRTRQRGRLASRWGASLPRPRAAGEAAGQRAA